LSTISISLAAEDEVFKEVPIIHKTAVLLLPLPFPLPLDPFVSLLFGDVFLRFASKSSGSGELGGETCRLMLTAAASELDPEVEAAEVAEAVTAMFPITVPVPNELIAI